MRAPTAPLTHSRWRSAYRGYIDGDRTALLSLISRARLDRAVQLVGKAAIPDQLMADLAGRLVVAKDWAALRALLHPIPLVHVRYVIAAAVAEDDTEGLLQALRFVPEKNRPDALVCAAGAGSEKCLRFLLRANVDPDHQTKERFGVARGKAPTVSALEQAVLKDQVRCARLLMARGAVRCSDRVLRLAKRRGGVAIVEIVTEMTGERRVA